MNEWRDKPIGDGATMTRRPNDICCICGRGIYRRPSDKDKSEVGYCKEHVSVAQAIRAKALNDKRYHVYIQRWLAGLENGMRGKTSTSNHIKRWLRESFGEKYSVVGWAEINSHSGRIPLEISHEDGDFRNNRSENLCLLCPNCHSLTSTYKALNKGKGRPRYIRGDGH